MKLERKVQNYAGPTKKPRAFGLKNFLRLLIVAAILVIWFSLDISAKSGNRSSSDTRERLRHSSFTATQKSGHAQTHKKRRMALSVAANSDAALLSEVSQHLLLVAGNHPNRYRAQYVWPPQIVIEDSSKVNAYASVSVDTNSGRFRPRIVIYRALMDDLIEKDPDRLAFILGHELAHIILGHVLPSSPFKPTQTATLSTIFTAEQEHEADLLGMRLALEANYSIRGAREVWLRIMSEDFLKGHPGWNYTSFEGVGIDHPAWTDRLALIDSEKEILWKSMSTFENGVFFLSVQQYASAEESFTRVVDSTGCPRNCKGFPSSDEAWANLGYAILMQYCDKLDSDDIARFDVGQLVVGSFYSRPASLTPRVRGINAKLWNKAVAALRSSVELNPNATLANANLGLAYLLAPTGKNAAQATRYLDKAIAAAGNDKRLNETNYLALLVNSGVSLLAKGDNERAKTRFDQAVVLAKYADSKATRALQYNRALLISRSGDAHAQTEALSLLDEYLMNESPESLWWRHAYALYSRLSSAAGHRPRTMDEFGRTNQATNVLRKVTSVDLGRGRLLTLSDPINSAKEKLGATTPLPVWPDSNLMKLAYPSFGVDILATRRIVVIFLRGANAPSLKLRSLGIGSPVTLLKIGMTEKDILRTLGTDYQVAPLDDLHLFYYFYPEIGVAIRYDATKRVVELALTRITIGQG